MANRPPDAELERMLAEDVPDGQRVVSAGVTARFRVVERAPRGPWIVQHLELKRALGGQAMGHSWKTLAICSVDQFEAIETLHKDQAGWLDSLRARGSLRRKR